MLSKSNLWAYFTMSPAQPGPNLSPFLSIWRPSRYRNSTESKQARVFRPIPSAHFQFLRFHSKFAVLDVCQREKKRREWKVRQMGNDWLSWSRTRECSKLKKKTNSRKVPVWMLTSSHTTYSQNSLTGSETWLTEIFLPATVQILATKAVPFSKNCPLTRWLKQSSLRE